MAATPSIKMEMHTPYKGGTKVWSNRYHFTGGTPSDAAHWLTLAQNIRDAFKLCLGVDSTIQGWTAYGAGSDVPVASGSMSQAGLQTAGTGMGRSPLETAALLRWPTTARTSKNHPIYLFSYIHNVYVNYDAGDFELLDAAQKTTITTFGNAWVTGFSDGVNTYHRAGPNGATGGTATVNQYVTHRDFRD